jgi:hypothetical protein
MASLFRVGRRGLDIYKYAPDTDKPLRHLSLCICPMSTTGRVSLDLVFEGTTAPPEDFVRPLLNLRSPLML